MVQITPLDPRGARLRMGSSEVEPFGIQASVKKARGRFDWTIFPLRRDFVAKNRNGIWFVGRIEDRLEFRQLHRIGRRGRMDTVDFETVGVESDVIGGNENASLMAFRKNFVVANVKNSPVMPAVVGAQEPPILWIAFGKIVGR